MNLLLKYDGNLCFDILYSVVGLLKGALCDMNGKQREGKQTERLVIEGNAIYELDLECVQRKQMENKETGGRKKQKEERKDN